MDHYPRPNSHLAAALLIIVLVVMAAPPHPLGAVDTAPPTALTMTGLTPDQEHLVTWAIGLFEAGGLELPPVDVVGHTDDTACLGRAGAARWDDGRSEISLCTPEAGPVQEMLIVHELAHAWDRHDLEEGARRAFLNVRGLEQWRGDAEWHDRGAEHAAEIITWGLMDRPVRPVRIADNTCGDLLEGYETLTGRAPLHGFFDLCE